MPELPEVETIRAKLAGVLPGKSIISTLALHPKSGVGDFNLVENCPIKSVNRKAKLLQIEFQNGMSLVVHLKMTGQLIFVGESVKLGGGHPTADWVQDLPSSHTRLVFELDSGETLYFNDQRIFGWVKVMDPEKLGLEFAKYAPDINTSVVTAQFLFDRLKNRSIPIKQALLDSKIVSGLGNIYVCDALNLAKVSPFRSAKTVSLEELDRIVESAKHVIDLGIKLGGSTTDGKFVDIGGFAGGYQDVMLTYDRTGQPCKNCQEPIIKDKIAGRGTYFCKNCQL